MFILSPNSFPIVYINCFFLKILYVVYYNSWIFFSIPFLIYVPSINFYYSFLLMFSTLTLNNKGDKSHLCCSADSIPHWCIILKFFFSVQFVVVFPFSFGVIILSRPLWYERYKYVISLVVLSFFIIEIKTINFFSVYVRYIKNYFSHGACIFFNE